MSFSPVAATAAVLLASTVSAFADCVPGYRFVTAEDQTVTTTMTPQVGKRCSLRLGTTDMRVSGVKVVRAPSHGRLATSRSRIVYTAGRSPGPDRFTFEWVGRNRWGRPAFMGVDVTVTILP